MEDHDKCKCGRVLDEVEQDLMPLRCYDHTEGLCNECYLAAEVRQCDLESLMLN